MSMTISPQKIYQLYFQAKSYSDLHNGESFELHFNRDDEGVSIIIVDRSVPGGGHIFHYAFVDDAIRSISNKIQNYESMMNS